jgi:hypothetical protein
MLERIREAVRTLVAAAGIPGVATLLQGVPPHGGGQAARAPSNIAAARPRQGRRTSVGVHSAPTLPR